MYGISVDNNVVVSFSQELNVVGEMVRIVYSSFIKFASRLCSLEKRILSFREHQGYRWIDGKERRSLTSDFYGYVKVNQRHISNELDELNAEFEQCKKQAESLMVRIIDCETLVINISSAPLVNQDNIIPFESNKKKDRDVVRELSKLLDESEKLSRDIRMKYQSVSQEAAGLVLQMRGQLQG